MNTTELATEVKVALGAAALAFAGGDERRALTLLSRQRDLHPPGTLAWAQLERLVGLVLIHVLREVEGTFALERADAALDVLQAADRPAPRPTLAWLEDFPDAVAVTE